MLFLLVNCFLIIAGMLLFFLKNWPGAGVMGLMLFASMGLYIYSKINTSKKERYQN